MIRRRGHAGQDGQFLGTQGLLGQELLRAPVENLNLLPQNLGRLPECLLDEVLDQPIDRLDRRLAVGPLRLLEGRWRGAEEAALPGAGAHPKLSLFDEPLSNLDAEPRVEMRFEIKQLHARIGAANRLRHARPDRGNDDDHPGLP
jgi:hypothetical protein